MKKTKNELLFKSASVFGGEAYGSLQSPLVKIKQDLLFCLIICGMNRKQKRVRYIFCLIVSKQSTHGLAERSENACLVFLLRVSSGTSRLSSIMTSTSEATVLFSVLASRLFLWSASFLRVA